MTLTCGDNGSTGQQVIDQINTNTTAIAANVVNISGNADDILALQELNSFASDARGTTLGIPETYTEVGLLSVNLASGKYVLYMSAAYSYDQVSNSVYQKITVNGIDQEFRREPKDTTDVIPQMYAYPLDWAGGVFNASIYFRKDTALGVLDVFKSALWIEKKAEL